MSNFSAKHRSATKETVICKRDLVELGRSAVPPANTRKFTGKGTKPIEYRRHNIALGEPNFGS